jgi:hypothetical protein
LQEGGQVINKTENANATDRLQKKNQMKMSPTALFPLMMEANGTCLLDK